MSFQCLIMISVLFVIIIPKIRTTINVYSYLFSDRFNDIECGDLVKCHGFCVKSDSYCPTGLSCNEGLKLINMYSCALDSTFTPPAKCISHFFGFFPLFFSALGEI